MRTATLSLLFACSEYKLHESESELEGVEDTAGLESDSRIVVDSWFLDQRGGTDVLFFGDTSGSMTQELETMGERIHTFVNRLDDLSIRWQLLAVTGPDGCGIHGVIDPSMSDYASTFSDAITTPPGEDLVDEWGLYNAREALWQTEPGGCNEGFLRPEAMLQVVFISDENDNSPGWDTGNADYWREYVFDIMAAKDSPEQVMFSAVSGPSPDGCAGAEPGTGYNEVVDWTGGTQLSICDEWQDQLTILADAILQQAVFELSDKPIPDSLGVEVNGLPRTQGWNYNPSTRSVVFLEEAPGTGDHVEVTYEVLNPYEPEG